jgi:hypothetical protein
MEVQLPIRVDALLGDGIEPTVQLKHRRRLRRLGQDHALDPPDGGIWASAHTPPRPGCEVEVLIDGASALPEITRALRHAKRFITDNRRPIACSLYPACRGERAGCSAR